MEIEQSLREKVVSERLWRETFIQEASVGIKKSSSWGMNLINRGSEQKAIEDLLFFSSPTDFSSILQSLQREIRDVFSVADEEDQERYLRFVVDLVLSLRSFLPRWNLQNKDRYREAALTDAQIKTEMDRLQALATELAALAPVVAEDCLNRWRAEAVARLKAESASNPEDEAKALIGSSVREYVDNLSRELASSNVRRIADMQTAGQTLTEFSNDYAAFLKYAMYLGASFVTCNPPLVDLAWVADPERWNPVVDGIIADHPGADADALARLVTMEIVLDNMRLLRPIFLLNEGQLGCVCLQVNPRKHDDAGAMIADALFLYDSLQSRLDGGVPNVVFKLPGTKAGLEACRALTERGIGVTITVNFGLFQHLSFAQAIHEGQAIFACLVEMNGRLAYPVRDELLAKRDQLAAHGIDEAKAREAAAWSGVAVLKRLHQLLRARGYDLSRIKPLVASLRIYRGEGYDTLPSAFPDITEVMGASIISVFPNIRHAFDSEPEIALDPQRIESPVPEDILDILTHSEIFKQAYYVADGKGMEAGDDRFRPDYELTLEDETGTATWSPVHNTLTEFCNSYDAFVQRILERKRSPGISSSTLRPETSRKQSVPQPVQRGPSRSAS